MLLDGLRWPADIHLLNDLGLIAVGTNHAATTWTRIKHMGLEVRHLLRGERLTLVLGMARLTAYRAFDGLISRRRLGLTMSEEGGLEEVDEFFWAAASCSRNKATSARRASTMASKRRQPGQDFLDGRFMAESLYQLRPLTSSRERERFVKKATSASLQKAKLQCK